MRSQPDQQPMAAICRGLRITSALALAALLCAATPCGQSQQDRQQDQQGQPNASNKQAARTAPATTPAPPAASATQPSDKPSAPAANLSPEAARQQELAQESAQLLKLATDLKAEVDKTTKDTLSIAVIRKADAVERMARGVKEKFRVEAASASN